MTAHVPRHRLERLGKGRPGQLGDAAAHTHVAGCDHCAVRKRALDAASQRYLAAHPPLEFAQAVLTRAAATAQPAAPRRALRGARLLWTAVALAAIAALALLAVRPRQPEPVPAPVPATEADAIRLKGGVSFEVFARQGGRVLPVHDGASLSGGDQLAFAYRLGSPAHLLLLGIDARGVITRYYPAAGLASFALPVGPREQVPVGVELDQHAGEERIIALFSAEPLDETAVRRSLAEAFARAGGAGVAALSRIDVAAEQFSVWFRKP